MATAPTSATGAPSLNVDLSSIYGTSNAAAQMLSDIPLSTYEDLQVGGLTSQLSMVESQITAAENKDQAWTTLQSDASALNTAFSGLMNPANYVGSAVSSSQPAVLNATSDATAVPGSYTVTVQQLATQEIDGTDSTTSPITSASTALNLASSTISLTIQGTTYSVAITPSMGLASIASALNAAGAPVTAMDETDGANGTQYLSIFGNQVGQSITYGGSTAVWQAVGILSNTGSVNQVQAASDAEISVGSGNFYTSSTDTFANVLPGITLQAASTGTATITLSPDYQTATNTIQTLTGAINQWTSDTQNLAFSTLPSVSASGTVAANPNQVITSPIPMSDVNQLNQTLLDFDSGGYSLSELGVTINEQGQWSVNSSMLSSAMTNDAQGVQQFFVALASTAAPLITTFGVGPNSVTGESITSNKSEISTLQNQATMIESEVADQQTAAQAAYSAWSDNSSGG